MKVFLNKLYEHRTLQKEEAREILINIANGKYSHSEVASFITVFLMRSITVEELQGFRDALLELCVKLDFSAYECIDVCGTGGDSKNTFNISTLSTFIIAAAGVKVAKHGNYGVSSVSGSSNVMEYFGYKFTSNESLLKKQLDICNVCFMHAPLFHPALKNVAPIRKELGVKTFFNMLGPLVNPANPRFRLVGVYNLELARVYNYLLQPSTLEYRIVHSLDGYDEISNTGDFKVYSRAKEELLSPTEFGIPICKQEELFGGDSVEDSATLFLSILKGAGTSAQNNAILINSGFAINCAKPSLSVIQSIELAKETLISGKAYQLFKNLIALN